MMYHWRNTSKEPKVFGIHGGAIMLLVLPILLPPHLPNFISLSILYAGLIFAGISAFATYKGIRTDAYVNYIRWKIGKHLADENRTLHFNRSYENKRKIHNI